jgi:hypothetical protein
LNKIIFLSQIHQRFFNFFACISNVRTLLQPILSIHSFLLLATQATRGQSFAENDAKTEDEIKKSG